MKAQTGLTLRYDELLHRKLKVIAVYRDKSLNSLIAEILGNEVSDWEKEHGKIEFPE
jgi:predicted HicB family RNase H-like nuclease